jgi:hypothetical protein
MTISRSTVPALSSALCLAVLCQCATAQFVYQQDTREIAARIERYWLLNGFPISEDVVSDSVRPVPDFSDFDDTVGVSIELGPDSYFRCDASLVSRLTPTSISGAGSVRAEEGAGTPPCDDDYYALSSGDSRVYVEFVIESESLVAFRAEQTLVEGEGRVAVQLGRVDEPPFEDISLSAATTDRREATFRLGPGAYRLIVWNSLDLYCEPGVTERSDFETELALLGTPCNPADQAAPVGVLDLADVQACIGAFIAGESLADIAAPSGVLDLADVQAFVTAFVGGCP